MCSNIFSIVKTIETYVLGHSNLIKLIPTKRVELGSCCICRCFKSWKPQTRAAWVGHNFTGVPMLLAARPKARKTRRAVRSYQASPQNTSGIRQMFAGIENLPVGMFAFPQVWLNSGQNGILPYQIRTDGNDSLLGESRFICWFLIVHPLYICFSSDQRLIQWALIRPTDIVSREWVNQVQRIC